MDGGGFGARRARQGEIDVVAVGASAGGILALGALMRALPANLPTAFVIVQHRSPISPSGLLRVLGRTTRMRFVEPRQDEVLVASNVYLAPADTHLTIAGNRMHLSSAPRVHYSRPSIDVLFSSVARARDCRAIAVALTCANDDGAAGATDVHHGGGRVIVESGAEFPQLASAILASIVPHVSVDLSGVAWAIQRLFARS
jgi:two-component system chemotaxis response regulator CheB